MRSSLLSLSPSFSPSSFSLSDIFHLTGDDVIVHPTVPTDEARTLWPAMKIVKPYLRFTPLPREHTTASV